ncbi:hypothetical protein K432DRAFT_420968 [Lepidopterella palustris CBS 459.81]|uniref:Uncharacterized protein n=1 Tax=Lepidopterella palustris CBS 459.81 TaxID=1314670 RepID=A0A8E2ELU9_9PEZI|nr:hypothetical protein K432DRAFT_420968 [Lepidopterella palustris CBS 459.81]
MTRKPPASSTATSSSNPIIPSDAPTNRSSNPENQPHIPPRHDTTSQFSSTSHPAPDPRHWQPVPRSWTLTRREHNSPPGPANQDTATYLDPSQAPPPIWNMVSDPATGSRSSHQQPPVAFSTDRASAPDEGGVSQSTGNAEPAGSDAYDKMARWMDERQTDMAWDGVGFIRRICSASEAEVWLGIR